MGDAARLGLALLCRKKEGELRAQLPISPRRLGGHYIVVSGELGIDGLVADLEHAPEATTQGYGPAVVAICFPIRGDDGRGCQIPALGKVVIEERLQRHQIDVGPVLIAGKGPEIIDQEAGDHIWFFLQEKHDQTLDRPTTFPTLIGNWSRSGVEGGASPQTSPTPGDKGIGFVGEKKSSGARSPSPKSVSSPKEKRWLIDHRQDRARDQVPVSVEMDRKDRLKV